MACRWVSHPETLTASLRDRGVGGGSAHPASIAAAATSAEAGEVPTCGNATAHPVMPRSGPEPAGSQHCPPPAPPPPPTVPPSPSPPQAGPMPTPTTVVLFGATGDLARRKLLPGLLHLFESGLMPKLQVVGTALDEHDRDSFVELARQAIEEYGGEGPNPAGWQEFAKRLHWADGKGGADAGWDDGRGRRGAVWVAGAAPAALPERPAQGSAAGRAPAQGRRPRRPQPDHHGEAVRHRPRVRPRPEQQAARGLRRGPDLPDRPLPRQGGSPEHPGVPLRQRAVRADLAPQPHRPRADRRARGARPGPARPTSTSPPGPTATWW